jgi:hypothetical protein
MIRLANSNAQTGGNDVQDTASLNDFFPLSSVVFAAMEKVGAKQKKPDHLADGASHSVRMLIKGEVDGQLFEQSIVSIVSIGHRQEKSSSVNPQVAELIAYVLSKLNSATRERILADVPTDFCDNGMQLPESSKELVNSAKAMLKKLRATKTVTARGPVRCEYTLMHDTPAA